MNKLFIILFVFYLTSQGFSQTCYVKQYQYHNLMEHPGISDNLVKGVLNFNQKYYYLNSDLPIPTNNFLLRFQWYRSGHERLSQIFIIRDQSSSNYFQLVFRFNKMEIQIKSYGDVENSYSVDLSNKLNQEYVQFAFYLTKTRLHVYYNGEHRNSFFGQFSLSQFSGTKYYIDTPNNDPRGFMKGLSIVQNIYESQLSCLTGYSTIKLCPTNYWQYNKECEQYNLQEKPDISNLEASNQQPYDQVYEVKQFLPSKQQGLESLYDMIINLFN